MGFKSRSSVRDHIEDCFEELRGQLQQQHERALAVALASADILSCVAEARHQGMMSGDAIVELTDDEVELEAARSLQKQGLGTVTVAGGRWLFEFQGRTEQMS